MTMIPRLSDDIALLTVDRDISLASPYVNTACLPSCTNQFSHVFSNGSGVRCHVAGWGKDEIDGTFQFIPKKVNTLHRNMTKTRVQKSPHKFMLTLYMKLMKKMKGKNKFFVNKCKTER